MVIDFGDGMEFEATFNGFTPIVFSSTFSVEKPNGATRPKDINEDVGMIVETMKSCGMPSMTALLEIAYACIKTAKPRWGLGFDKWVKSLPPAAFDLQKGDGWAADVMGIVEDNFFPSTPDGVEAAPAEAASAATA